MPDDSRHAGAEVEITPKMVEAGAWAAREHALGASLHDLVWVVYLAMEAERKVNLLDH